MTKEDTKEAQQTDGGKLTAKNISKIFKFVSALGIIVCAVFKWIGRMPDASAAEICMIWAAVYGIGAGTIDLNIMFDKFSGGKK